MSEWENNRGFSWLIFAFIEKSHLMKNKWIIEIISALLICLFAYASISKILVFSDFRTALFNQPIPYWSARLLSWILPITELIAVGLLINSRTKLVGLCLCTLLMLIFTGYVGLILAGGFGRIPCSCGGILKNMGWHTHLIFNIFFLAIAIIGIILFKKQKNREQRSSPVMG